MKLSHAFLLAIVANIIGGLIVLWIEDHRGKANRALVVV